jgi:hypothetical protein
MFLNSGGKYMVPGETLGRLGCCQNERGSARKRIGNGSRLLLLGMGLSSPPISRQIFFVLDLEQPVLEVCDCDWVLLGAGKANVGCSREASFIPPTLLVDVGVDVDGWFKCKSKPGKRTGCSKHELPLLLLLLSSS